MARSRAEIKHLLYESLGKFPHTCHELSRIVNCDYKTVRRNLEELESLGATSQFEKKIRGDIKTFWKLNVK